MAQYAPGLNEPSPASPSWSKIIIVIFAWKEGEPGNDAKSEQCAGVGYTLRIGVYASTCVNLTKHD